MFKEEVITSVKAMIGEILGDAMKAAALTADSKLIEECDGFDSLDRAELLMLIEDRYNITITDKEASEAATIDQISALICRKVC